MLRKQSDSLMVTEDDFSEIEIGADGERLYKPKSIRSKTHSTYMGLGSRSNSIYGSNSMIGGPHSVYYGASHSVYGGSNSMYGHSRPPYGVSRSVCGGFNRSTFDYRRDFDNRSVRRYRDASPVSIRSLRSIDPTDTESLQMYLQETFETVIYPLQEMIQKSQLRQPNLQRKRFMREARQGSEENTDESSEDRFSNRSELPIRYKKRFNHKAHPYARREEQFLRGERSRSNSVLGRQLPAKPLNEPFFSNASLQPQKVKPIKEKDLRNLTCTAAAADDDDIREQIRAGKENVASNNVKPKLSKRDHEFLKPKPLPIQKKSSFQPNDIEKNNEIANSANNTTGKNVNQSKRLSDVSEVPENAENVSNDSMRPSFIKRKLFTLSQDVVLEKDFNDSKSDSPVNNFYSSVPRPKNKVDNVVPDQPSVKRNIFESSSIDINMRELINQLVPQEKLNLTVENLKKTQERTSIHSGNIKDLINKVTYEYEENNVPEVQHKGINPPQETIISGSNNLKLNQNTEKSKQNKSLSKNLSVFRKDKQNNTREEIKTTPSLNKKALEQSAKKIKLTPYKSGADVHNVKTTNKSQNIKIIKEKQNVKTAEENKINKSNQFKQIVKTTDKNQTNKTDQENPKVRAPQKAQNNKLTANKQNVKTKDKNETSNLNQGKQTAKVSENAENNKLTHEKNNVKTTEKYGTNKPNQDKQKAKTSEQIHSNNATQEKHNANAAEKNQSKHNHEKQKVVTSEKERNNKLIQENQNTETAERKQNNRATKDKLNFKTSGQTAKGLKVDKPKNLNQRTRSLENFSSAQKKMNIRTNNANTSIQTRSADKHSKAHNETEEKSESDHEISFRMDTIGKQEADQSISNRNTSGEAGLRRSTRKITPSSRFSNYLFDNTPQGLRRSKRRTLQPSSYLEYSLENSPTGNKRENTPNSSKRRKRELSYDNLNVPEKQYKKQRSVSPTYTASDLGSPRPVVNKCVEKCKVADRIQPRRSPRININGKTTDKNELKEIVSVKKVNKQKLSFGSKAEPAQHKPNVTTKPMETPRKRKAIDSFFEDSSDECTPPVSIDRKAPKVTNDTMKALSAKKNGDVSKSMSSKPNNITFNDKQVFKQPLAVGKASLKNTKQNGSLMVGRPRANTSALSNTSKTSVRTNSHNRSAIPAKIMQLMESDWEDENSIGSNGTNRRMPSSTKNYREQSPARSVISMRSEMVRPSLSTVHRAARTFNSTKHPEELYDTQTHNYEPGMTSLTVGVKPCFYRAMNSTRNNSRFDDNASVASAHSFKSFRSVGRLHYPTLHF